MKLVGTRWAVVHGSFAHHDVGAGLWTDINNIHTRYQGNRVGDNSHVGIVHEISYAAVIRGNTVRRNGSRGQGRLHAAGILVAGSPDVEVVGNTVVDDPVGIAAK